MLRVSHHQRKLFIPVEGMQVGGGVVEVEVLQQEVIGEALVHMELEEKGGRIPWEPMEGSRGVRYVHQ